MVWPTKSLVRLSGSNQRLRIQQPGDSIAYQNKSIIFVPKSRRTKTLSDLHLHTLIRLSEHLSRRNVKVRKLYYERGAYLRVLKPCLAHERNLILTLRVQEYRAGSGACCLSLAKLHILEFRDHFYPSPSGLSHSGAPFTSLGKCTLFPAAPGKSGKAVPGERAQVTREPARHEAAGRAWGAPYP